MHSNRRVHVWKMCAKHWCVLCWYVLAFFPLNLKDAIVVQRSCGAISSNNNTYFQNPSFPNVFLGANTCSLTVQRCSPDVCQIRIDFLSFSLVQPNGDGICANDALIISGAATNTGRICGENTGQHIYLDFNNENNIDVSIFTSSAISIGRQWNLRIAQIGCDSPSRGRKKPQLKILEFQALLRLGAFRRSSK